MSLFEKIQNLSIDERNEFRIKPHVHNSHDVSDRNLLVRYELSLEDERFASKKFNSKCVFNKNYLKHSSNKTILNKEIFVIDSKEEPGITARTNGAYIEIGTNLCTDTELAKTVIAHEYGHILLEHTTDKGVFIDNSIYDKVRDNIDYILEQTNSCIEGKTIDETIDFILNDKQALYSVVKYYASCVRGIAFDYAVNEIIIDDEEYMSLYIKLLSEEGFEKFLKNEFDVSNMPIISSYVGSSRHDDVLYNADLIIEHAKRTLPKCTFSGDGEGEGEGDGDGNGGGSGNSGGGGRSSSSSKIRVLDSNVPDALKDLMDDQGNLLKDKANGKTSYQSKCDGSDDENTEEAINKIRERQNKDKAISDQLNKEDYDRSANCEIKNKDKSEDCDFIEDKDVESGVSGEENKQEQEQGKSKNTDFIKALMEMGAIDPDFLEINDCHSRSLQGNPDTKIKIVKRPIDVLYDLIVKQTSKRVQYKRENKMDPLYNYNRRKFSSDSRQTLVPKVRKIVKPVIDNSYMRAIFVVDVSSSMDASEISEIINTIDKAAKSNKKKFDFTIVTWDTDLVQILDLSNLNDMCIGGGTDIARGIKYVIKNYHKSCEDKIFVISDLEDDLNDWDDTIIKSPFYKYENTYAIETSNGYGTSKLKNFQNFSLVRKSKK